MFKVFSPQKNFCQSEKTAIIKFWWSASVFWQWSLFWATGVWAANMMATALTIWAERPAYQSWVWHSGSSLILSVTVIISASSQDGCLQSRSARQGVPSSPKSWPHQSHCPRPSIVWASPSSWNYLESQFSSSLNLILIGPWQWLFSHQNSFFENK